MKTTMKFYSFSPTAALTLIMAALMGMSLESVAQNIVSVELSSGERIQRVLSTDMQMDFPREGGAEKLRISHAAAADTEVNLGEVTDMAFLAATDLQGGSNCYIVSRPGTYSFAPTRVDGSEISGIVRADWLWMETAAEDLIRDVAFTDGRIVFTAAEGKGNATIAAADAAGQIVWVWHIWMTDQPRDMRFKTEAVVMDRNLGAVSAREEDGRDTWGLVYQYGRSVPFYYAGDNQEYNPSEAFDQARKFTRVNPAFGQKWGLEAGKTDEGYTLSESMARPMTHLLRKYVAGSLGGYHWAPDADLEELTWGNQDITYKTNYDPCPPGYKVPFSEELADLADMTWDPAQQGNMEKPVPGFYVNTEDGQQWWPMVCGRNYDDGCALYGGKSTAYSDRLFLWTAYAGYYSPNILSRYPYVPLRILVENNYPDESLRLYSPLTGAGAFGHTVRCVRESLPAATARNYTPGDAATDLRLTLADGAEASLMSLVGRTPLTVVYFNNPDCPACRTMQQQLEESAALQRMQASGKLQVISIYTDEEAALWQAHTADYPASWTVTMDAQQQVLTQGLYNLRTTPSLYLIDAQGRVLQADTDIRSLENIE